MVGLLGWVRMGLGEDGVARGILERHGLRKSYGKGGKKC